MNSFNKYPHPANFDFADRFGDNALMIDARSFELHTAAAGGRIHLAVTNAERWPQGAVDPIAGRPLAAHAEMTAGIDLTISASAGLRLSAPGGDTLLEAGDGRWFGVSGRRWGFRFETRATMQFFGLGEKHAPFERSGRAYWFWNADAWADHPIERVKNADYDPDYLSVPYLIVKQAGIYIGLLLDTPYPAFVSLRAPAAIENIADASGPAGDAIFLGAENGAPSLYLLFGPSLAELTRRLQMLTGPAPLPPLWSLGYHQSRWGYRGAADLQRLADRFARHRFPADGLWLDIDYMDGCRVFTIDARQLPQPAQTIAALKKRGFRVVPILDPGIKREKGYTVFDSGRTAGVFCLNPTGKEFTGMVWPGQTVFPDFSLPEARHWWATHARRFFELGFEGAWLDMNEPATGSVDCRDMRFNHGRSEHDTYHNAYARLMARATRRGMLAARSNRRPFLLSRAGNTGSQRYCAHWTGDNFSSYRHLRRSIGLQLNLGLSGVPVNGSDVGGFGGDCPQGLLIDWFKAAFLMPFFRNHTMRGSRDQEPWAYSAGALKTIRRFVRLRYTLLPYLYNLFIDQEEKGEAILRPLFYDFDDDPELALSRVDDQFMVGPAILQAPFVHRTGSRRVVALPGRKWLRADTGRWVRGGRRLSVRRHRETTPLFLREGSLIPFQPGVRTTNRTDLNHIGLLCCLPVDFIGRGRLHYRADDGISLDYRRGRRSTVEIAARLESRHLHLALTTINDGYGPVEIVPYTLNRFRSVYFDNDGDAQTLQAVKERVRLTGRPFEWYRWVKADG